MLRTWVVGAPHASHPAKRLILPHEIFLALSGDALASWLSLCISLELEQGLYVCFARLEPGAHVERRL